MAFGGFNRNSGPFSQPGGEGGGGGGQNQFGNFPRSPSPPPVFPVNNNNYYSPPPQQRHSPRPSVSTPRLGSQTYQGPSAAEPYVDSPNAAVNIPARFANIQGPRRPRAPPSATNIYLDDFTQDVSVAAVPSISPPRWGAHSKSSFGDSISGAHQRPSSVPPYVASPSTTNIPARPSNFQVSPIRKSPRYNNEVSLDNFTQSSYGRGLGGPQRMQSPSQAFVGSRNVEDLHHPSSRWPTEPSNFQPPQKNTPIPLQSATEHIRRRSNPSQGDTNRAVVSPPMFGKTSTFSMNNSNPTSQQRSSSFSPHNEAESAGSKTMNSQVPKRNRSPSLASAEEHIPGTLNSASDDIEREVQAKARRLSRFGVELSEPVQRNTDNIKQKSPANRHDQAIVERRKLIPDQPAEAAGDYMQSDYEGLEPSTVIVGLCPDMCPESERQERERKGDLDRYERLDGDRNQTTTSLAVKKYTRTAEREADLIRPMPVLQQTMNYLLILLDQPYDDRFLSMYNFLWDRMRAIRMDLRMQHIFNEDAITMLEQMIRLHIIAMHELCEYTKGEGFSEGFDAHLNIEQMNKTSVELFQMYDDHRKKGITVVSEKEFRGYYALLKLDKHPGYKVEPAELSLDLAKMTPEIRQTREILFARAVARACRTGNFIAFFRLARKATYLQACLMHAHFAKLRTQALVSLHSGLQNQGIPIAQVTKWLGMEGEDIDGLLEYHGFLTKEFEESYMVKEGPFLNVDKDYPTKCSQLVHLKKSRRIIEDVSSSNQLMWPAEEQKHIELDKKVKTEFKTIQSVTSRPLLDVVDEVMEEEPVLLDDPQVEPGLEIPVFDQTVRSINEVSPVRAVSSLQQSPEKVVKMAKPTRETLRSDSLERTRNVQIIPMLPSERSDGSPESPVSLVVTSPEKDDETLISHQDSEDEESMIHDNESENEEDMALAYQDEEVALAKLKLILRKWKRVSSKRKELREQRQLAASFALSSLTLGPPINRLKAPLSHVLELDIDRAARERRARQERSVSKMNISEIVGEILSERNPDSKCICWKLILSSQPDTSSQSRWLHSKLIGDKIDNTNDESIWQTWVPRHHDNSPIRCLTVITEVNFDMLTEETFSGSGGFLFLVSGTTPLNLQKNHLHRLSMSFPSGSHLPLLILHGGQQEESLIYGLGLNELDRTRVRNFLIRSITEDGFFDSIRLREGLQWLASESPAQPVVHCVKPRDLIIHHLSASLGRLDNKNANPNDCISAFNEALEISITEITTAAESNPSGWPPLEIESDLPSVGWSSDSRLKPILSRIQSLKLRFFQDDLTWLDYGYEILKQKSELEDCLVRYLTLWMDKDLATREASVALQKGSFIELQGSSYRIRPNWVQIFRRIFNWRLMEEEDSSVYVMERREEEELGLDLGGCLSLPCLDDMVGVCYNTRVNDAKEVLHSSSDEMEEEEEEEEVVRESGDDVENEVVVVGDNKGKKEGDKLSELLEKCNVLQDKIDEKLSFYF